MKAICYNCKTAHKLNAKKFPFELRDKKTRQVEGFLCKKCAQKHMVVGRGKGIGWRQALANLISGKERKKQFDFKPVGA